MSQDRIVVVSTQRDAGQKAVACLRSVAQQEEPHTHVFVDDGSSDDNLTLMASAVGQFPAPVRAAIAVRLFNRKANRTCIQNVYEIIHELEPSAIVCWVDGDDHLAHPGVLSVIRQKYDANPELAMTWGQFIYENGTRGWASEFPAPIRMTRSFRNDVWRTTHLKTFRAGLFQKIRQEDLHRSVTWDELGFPPTNGLPSHMNTWITHAIDLAVMFPMLEMAAYDVEFIPLILYVYSGENGESHQQGTVGWNEAIRIRSMPKYERLTERAW